MRLTDENYAEDLLELHEKKSSYIPVWALICTSYNVDDGCHLYSEIIGVYPTLELAKLRAKTLVKPLAAYYERGDDLNWVDGAIEYVATPSGPYLLEVSV